MPWASLSAESPSKRTLSRVSESSGDRGSPAASTSKATKGDDSSDISRPSSLASMREEIVRTFSATKFMESDSMRGNAMKTIRSLPEGARKKKKSLSHWRHYQTISWRVDEHADFSLGEKMKITPSLQDRAMAKAWAKIKRGWHFAVSWVVPGLIGFVTAFCGHYIEKGVNYLNAFRFGYCSNSLYSEHGCLHNESQWVEWNTDGSPWNLQGYSLYVLISIVLATLSATLVWLFAPMARGSGIPEVKTILGGFCMNEALEFKTLIVKMIGLTLSVASGLSLGKEGPLVHVACCWSHLLARVSSRYSINESKRRELVSTAAAAGVAVAFGAPLGGVLFSFEEVSTMFPTKTMIRAFFASLVAATSLGFLSKNSNEHSGRLTMFVTDYKEDPHYSEYPYFVALGIIGGLVGALFVKWNIWISEKRLEGTPWRRRVPIVLEVALIALVTGITSYPNSYTQVMSAETIRALFHNCNDSAKPDMMGLCNDKNQLEPNVESTLMYILLAAAVIRFLQMTITFGTGVPCGLFVPSLFTGACIGRTFGMVVRSTPALLWNWPGEAPVPKGDVNPGVYAMIGAAAVLGGVCRVTISLVVIMFELTNCLTMVVPFMVAVLTAKIVGDQFTGGIYDCCIKLRGYPYLHEPDDITFNSRACDIMDSDLDCLTLEPGTMDELLTSLETTKYSGIPLVRSEQEPQLIGFVFKAQLIEFIKAEKQKNPVNGKLQVAFKQWCKDPKSVKGIDLSEHVDAYIMRIVPETPLAQVHNIFRQLGVKLLLITMFGELKGMITKKAYLDELSNGHIGHITDDPITINVVEKAKDEGKISPFRGSSRPKQLGRQTSPEVTSGTSSIKLTSSPSLQSCASGATFRLTIHRPEDLAEVDELEEGLLPKGELRDLYHGD